MSDERTTNSGSETLPDNSIYAFLRSKLSQELRDLAKRLGLKNYSKMRKEDLIELLVERYNADMKEDAENEKQPDFRFDKPEDWKIIKPEYYKDFAILSTEAIPCLYGFATERQTGGGYEVISVFDYGAYNESLIEDISEALHKLEENNQDVDKINDYIRDNAEGYALTNTTSMRPLFHKTAKNMFGKEVFVNLMEIQTNVGHSYSLQLFVKIKTNMLCFGTNMLEIDTDNPFESAIERYQHVDDLVNIVIKSLE